MNLLPQLRVRDRDNLFKFSCLRQEFSMMLRLDLRWVILKAAHHVHDTVVWEHHLKERCFVEEQDTPDNLIEVMQAFPVFQVLAYSEQTQEFFDVALTH